MLSCCSWCMNRVREITSSYSRVPCDTRFSHTSHVLHTHTHPLPPLQSAAFSYFGTGPWAPTPRMRRGRIRRQRRKQRSWLDVYICFMSMPHPPAESHIQSTKSELLHDASKQPGGAQIGLVLSVLKHGFAFEQCPCPRSPLPSPSSTPQPPLPGPRPASLTVLVL